MPGTLGALRVMTMTSAPRFYSVYAASGGKYLPVVYLFALYPVGDNGDILALDERRLNRQYSDIYDLKPIRLARPGENIIARASIDYRRGKWPDILYIGHSEPMAGAWCVSRRVYEALESENVKSYHIFPVEPEAKRPGSGLPKGRHMPEYLALLSDQGLKVELIYSDVTPKRDPRLAPMSRKFKRSIAKEDTWKGFDLFQTGAGQTCCTRRIVELAREHRWTNFEFKPLDVRRDMPTEGIDYLGEPWPPESWYPPSPSEGKTVEPWVEAYMEQTRKAHEEARNPQHAAKTKRLSRKAREKAWNERQRPNRALMYDLAAEAVPLFIDILQHSKDEVDRSIAARMLLTLAQHTRIDTNVLAELVLPVFEHSLRKGETGFGHATIALDSYIEVPKDILDLAHKATGKPPMIMPAEWRK